MSRKLRVHKHESDGDEGYVAHWIACRDPERFQPDDKKRYIKTYDWLSVTCKRCLKRRGK